MIDIGAVTTQLIETLRTESAQHIGDGIRPEGAGWLDGDPNSGVFAPYAVLAFAGGQPREVQAMTYAESIRAWTTTWRITHFGATRSQCDWTAGQVRAAVAKAMKQTAAGYTITSARWVGLGALVRDDAINPPLWSVADSFVLHLDA